MQHTPYAIRYLQSVKSGSNYVLSFSWAETDMLYRFGMYYPANGILKLQKTDISGGIFFPVILPNHTNSSNTHRIIYTGTHGTYHRLYSLNETLLETAEAPLEPLKTIQTGRKPDMEILSSAFPYQPAAWLWRAKIRPAFKMPDSFKNIGSTGAGLTFFMLDPTETFELNPSFLVFAKPFFIQGNMNTSFHFKPLSLHIQVFDLLEGLLPVQRKSGLGAGISTSIPLSYRQQSLSLNYSTSTYWLAPYRTQSPSYYTAPYRCTIITQQGELIYRNMYSTQIAKTPFFAKIPQGIGFAAAAVHAYNIQKNNHSAVLQMQFKAAFPIIPIGLTFGGYAGYHAYYEPAEGLFKQPYTINTIQSAHYLPVLYAYKQEQHNSPGIYSYGISGLCDIMLFSYEIQRTFIGPLMVNRFSVHTGYAGIMSGDVTSKGTAAKIRYLDTLYLQCKIRVQDTADIGIEYTHPLRMPAQKGVLQGIFSINL